MVKVGYCSKVGWFYIWLDGSVDGWLRLGIVLWLIDSMVRLSFGQIAYVI